MGCQHAVDCVLEAYQSIPMYDGDNWECLDGGCHSTGCNDDQECQDTYTWSETPYACAPHYWDI